MLDDQEIKRLLLLTADRDAQAFERLYQRAAPLLLGIALRVAGRRELAEEVLHDSFVKIWNGAAHFDPLAERPVAWMASIVRNRAIDLVSSADVSRMQAFDSDTDVDAALEHFMGTAPGAEESAAQGQLNHSLHDCLQGLKASERQAVALAYMHGLSHGELAERLQRPLGTVKAWVRRGLENLRSCVESCLEPR
ncbi:MAG: RNA polymerase subunit sigma-24 [Azoarcus sp.]|nr:MAG: RNA polymerase subunit sigma-24 [Azoarcus sp.]